MRLFLDANILFSAAYSPGGRALGLFRLAGIGRCGLIGSNHVIEEARRNLMVKSVDRMGEFGRLFEFLEIVPEAPPRLVTWAAGHGLPACDAPVLAAAVVSRADFLVTGDRTHFGHLYGLVVGGVRVISLREALGMLLKADDE